MFNNFTQGGGKSNRSVVLAARVIFMVFRIRVQSRIPMYMQVPHYRGALRGFCEVRSVGAAAVRNLVTLRAT